MQERSRAKKKDKELEQLKQQRAAAERELASTRDVLVETLNQRGAEAGDDDENKLCVVCLDAEKVTAFEPCLHLCCCEACAADLSECPICRTEAKGKLRMYAS